MSRESRSAEAPGLPPTTVDVDGDGMIEMVGDDVGSMLLLAGEPVLLQGDTAGCSWLFARAGTQGSAEVKSLVEWVDSAELDGLAGLAGRHRPSGTGTGAGDQSGHGLDRAHLALRPLLRLLRPGRYLMSVRTPTEVHQVGFSAPGDHVWYFDPYGGRAEDIALVATDVWPPRDQARVAYYRSLVVRGRRPVVVALFPPDGFTGFLLDGHHKLAACAPVDPPPRIIALTPVRPFLPHNGQVRQAVPGFVEAVSEYHRHATVGILDHLRTLSLGVESDADELARTGRSTDAIVQYRDYLAYQRQYLASEPLDEHRTARVRLAMAENRHKLGRLLLHNGHRDEAEEHLRAALTVYTVLLGERHPDTRDLGRELDRLRRSPHARAAPRVS